MKRARQDWNMLKSLSGSSVAFCSVVLLTVTRFGSCLWTIFIVELILTVRQQSYSVTFYQPAFCEQILWLSVLDHWQSLERRRDLSRSPRVVRKRWDGEAEQPRLWFSCFSFFLLFFFSFFFGGGGGAAAAAGGCVRACVCVCVCVCVCDVTVYVSAKRMVNRCFDPLASQPGVRVEGERWALMLLTTLSLSLSLSLSLWRVQCGSVYSAAKTSGDFAKWWIKSGQLAFSVCSLSHSCLQRSLPVLRMSHEPVGSSGSPLLDHGVINPPPPLSNAASI